METIKNFIIIPILILSLLILSGIFSFSEMALASSSKIRLKTITVSNEKRKNKKRASRVLKFHDNYNEIITAIVILNNIINVLVTTITALWATLIIQNRVLSAVFSFLMMTLLIVLIGELIPKMLAKKYPERGSMYFSQVIYIANVMLKPINKLVGKIIKQDENKLFTNEEELKEAINEAEKYGIASKKEKEIISSLLKMDEEYIEKIMIKKEKCYFIYEDTPTQKIRNIIKKANVTRMPILNKNNVPIGIMNTNNYLIDYLEDNKVEKNQHIYDIQKYKPHTIINYVFEDLKNKRKKMAVIVDDDGKFKGIITIEDIIENMFGPIYDEQDFQENGIYKLSEHTFLIKPNVNANLIFENYINQIKKPNWLNKEMNFDEFVKKIDTNQKNNKNYIVYNNAIIWKREDTHNKNKKIYEIDII